MSMLIALLLLEGYAQGNLVTDAWGVEQMPVIDSGIAERAQYYTRCDTMRLSCSGLEQSCYMSVICSLNDIVICGPRKRPL